MIEQEPIRCTDACGASVLDEDEAAAQGWTQLQTTNRYRCPACVQQLNAINQPKEQPTP